MGRGMLFLMTGFIIIFGIVQVSVQNHQHELAKRTPEYYAAEQSKNIAFSMMEVAVARLNGNINEPQDATLGSESIMGGTGKIEFYKSIANFNTTVYLKITGTAGDKKTKTTIYAIANRPEFSIYAYFTDKEKFANGQVIYFTTGDVLNGPLHTNGKFHIQGDPVFNGPVTSHDGIYKTYGSDPEFNDSKDFSAKEIDLPEDAPEAVKLAKKENGGIGQFNDDIYVEFKGGDQSENNDGTVEISKPTWGCVKYEYYYNWRTGSREKRCARHDYVPDPSTTQTHKLSKFNDVISSTENVFVKGNIDGQATVHSKKNVKIMGDLYYENRNYEDKSKPISDDRLGIVSEEDTIVDQYAQEDHGSDDVYIDGSILTLGDSFKVENYDRGYNRGKIHLLGGLIQKTRGAVGLIGGSGYTKDYTYDSRFKKNSTPGFPKVKRFQIDSWRESTTVEKK